MTSTQGGPAPVSRPQEPVLVETAVDLAFHAVLVTAVFFLLRGHQSPGGGFIAGLVAATAFVLRYLAGPGAGSGAARSTPRPGTVLGIGLLLACATSVVPWFFGGQVLQSDHVDLHVPVLGDVPLTSVLAFDTGVFLVVVGIVLAVLATLGAQEDASLGPAGSSEDRT